MTFNSPNDGWQNPGQGQAPGAPYGQQYSQSSQATVALVVSIVSIVACCFLPSPVALYLGKKELSAIDQGLVDPAERGKANAAYIIGIVGTVLLVLGIVFYAILTVIAIGAEAA